MAGWFRRSARGPASGNREITLQLPVDAAGLIYLELFNLVDEATVFGDPTAAVPGEHILAVVRTKLFPGGTLAADDRPLDISLTNGDWAFIQALLETSPPSKGREQSAQERHLQQQSLAIVRGRSRQPPDA
ncbi:MAG TPA: hypothetical protein VGL39_00695 [Jatrophihabitantaceae bacterium]|jgi:hypothetical protein